MSLKVKAAPSPNFNERKRPVRFIVLHYTGMETGEEALEKLRDDKVGGRVSSHYFVEEDGRIFQLVGEDKRAWHAGRGFWKGEDDINSASIGIEIVNGGHAFGLPDFPEAQIAAVIDLVRDIMGRHGIAPADVIGHSDIAPGRKTDPGEKFPWSRLAEAGCALALPDTFKAGEPMAQLKQIGYAPEPGQRAVVEAFQRRWRPSRVDGALDKETRELIGRVASLA
ncbi:N-acetylmuramoyl-L-alanine amidase [Maricaulis sp. CAU 1757]